jgi:hypothetical protein
MNLDPTPTGVNWPAIALFAFFILFLVICDRVARPHEDAESKHAQPLRDMAKVLPCRRKATITPITAARNTDRPGA